MHVFTDQLFHLLIHNAYNTMAKGFFSGKKGVRALRGYFGPPMRSKNKSCFLQVSSY